MEGRRCFLYYFFFVFQCRPSFCEVADRRRGLSLSPAMFRSPLSFPLFRRRVEFYDSVYIYMYKCIYIYKYISRREKKISWAERGADG